MPIPKFDPRDPIIPKKNLTPDAIYAEPYRHAVVDSKVTHYNDLYTFLPGSKWKGVLFTQIKGADEEPAPFQIGKDIPLQQYKKVKNYELLLQGSGLQTTIDEIGQENLTGTCLVYPGWLVNFGDMFIADIGSGQAGLFTITGRPEKKSRFNDAVFEIQVKLQEVMTAELERQIDVYVQETYYFDRNYLKYGSNPYVVDDQYQDKVTLEKLNKEYREMYVNMFFDYQHNTFVVPDPKTAKTYDPFIVKAITSIIDLMQFNLMHRINRFNVSDFGIEKAVTLFDCLLDYKPEQLKFLAMRNYKVIPAHQFTKNIRAYSFAFSGFAQMVTPAGGPFDPYNVSGVGVVPMVPVPNGCCAGCDEGEWPVDSFGINLGGGGETVSDGTEGTVLPIVHKDAYILSKAFYDHDLPNMTKFERLLWSGMERTTVNAADVLVYYKSFGNWSQTDRFYLGPLLFILTEYALRSLYE